MSRKALLPGMLAVLFAGQAHMAFAHPGHAGHSFGDGATHPLFGLDHLLAMVAVGLLAARLGGRAIYLLPLGFLASMLAGGMIGASGYSLPMAELAIGGSVLVFGLLVAFRRVLPLALCLAIVAGFAAFHGYAHAAEMAAGGSFGAYAAGFLCSTALLLSAGVLSAKLIARHWSADLVRACGATISAASLMILLS